MSSSCTHGLSQFLCTQNLSLYGQAVALLPGFPLPRLLSFYLEEIEESAHRIQLLASEGLSSYGVLASASGIFGTSLMEAALA